MRPRGFSHPILRAIAAVLLSAVAISIAASEAYSITPPPTFTVNTVTDAKDAQTNGVCATSAGACSLRAAVAESNATNGATIIVPAGTYVLNGGSGSDIGDLRLSRSMTITGAARQPGPNATTIKGSNDRIFDVTAAVTISGVVISDGRAVNRNGGGINVSTAGNLTLRDSTVLAGTAAYGAGVYVEGTATISGTTISGNSATNRGGGIYTAGTLALLNSTIDGNTAVSGGGGMKSTGTTTIKASTITTNSTGTAAGGGVYRLGGSVKIWSSILADNIGAAASRECSGAELIGYNLLETAAGCSAGSSVVVSGDPALGPLANNGGATLTKLPATGSPAINVVPTASCVVAVDQRGTARPQPVGGNCDLGAVEVVPAATLGLTLAFTADAAEIGVGAGTVPVDDIPPGAFTDTVPDPVGSTGASKFGAIKFGAIKFGAIDLEESKFGAITLEDIKFGAIKFGAIDLAAAKFGAISLSDIDVDVEGGWASLLMGTQYEGAPLQTITFEDVVDLPSVQALSLSQVGLQNTLLRGVSVEALALGEFSIADVPLNDTVAAGTDVDRLQAWCAAIGPASCAAMGINPQDPATAANITPLTLNIAGISLESIDLSTVKFGAIKFGAIDLSSTKFGAIKFGAIKFGAIDLQSTKFGAIKFGAIKFGAINLASTKFGAIKFGAIDIRGTKFGAIKFGAIPAGNRATILNCSLVDCNNPNLTLADAALVGALRGTLSDIINLSDLSPEISQLSLADLLALVGIVSDLDDLTIADFFELSSVQEIYGLTLADWLPLLLDPGDMPWEQMDLDATPLQPVSDPLEPVLTYQAAATVTGTTASSLGFAFTLPPGFVFVPGSALFDGSPVANPVIGSDGKLLFTFNNAAPGTHTMKIGTRAGLVLGPAEATVDTTAIVGSSTKTASGTVSVEVVESFELGESPQDVKTLNDGVLVISHVGDSFDRDLYTFTVSPAQAAAGATADIFLSNLFVDYDLVLYGPPLNPLRGTPVRRINGLGDQGIDSSPGDDIVAPDPLDDLVIQPPAGTEINSISANRQTFDERLTTGTLRAGAYYLQVAGYNGAFDQRPYTLRMRLSTGRPAVECPPRAFPYTRPGATTVPSPASYPANMKTLFLVAPRQLEAWYGSTRAAVVMAGVAELAGQSTVAGGVLPVDSAAAGAYDAWNAAPCSIEASNDVVRAIGASIDAIRAARPSIENIVIVGDHASIPMALLVDGVTLSNQRSFAGEVQRDNEIGAAFAGGRFLSDDPYASGAGIAIYNHEVFFPELALGRLVGSPEVIDSQMQRFVDYGGRLDPETAASPLLELQTLVAGYDFLTNGAETIADKFADGGAPVDTLISESWSASDLRSRLTGANAPDIASVNAHYDPWRLLPANENAAGTQDDLFTTADVIGSDVLGGSFIYTMGCNSGVSLSDVAIGFPTQDWAEAFAGEGALFAGNGGFGYGDTELVALSERFYGLLTDHLVDGLADAETVQLGDAWRLAKQQYQSEVAVWTPYDEKVLQEATFYGLPMWRLGEEPSGVGPLAAADTAVTALDAPSATDTVQIAVNGNDVPASASDDALLERFDTADGSYWVADGDGTITAMYRPIEPQVTRNLGDAGARGAVITALTSYDIPGWQPRYFLPIPSGNDPLPAIDAVGDAIFPATLINLHEYEGASNTPQQQLLLAAGQFRPTTPGVGVQRVFTNFGVQLVKPEPGANLNDLTAPTIRRTSAAVVGTTVGFVVDVDPDATFVSVLYKRAGTNGAWVNIGLAETGTTPDGAARWTGGDVTGLTDVEFEYLVQTHDRPGNTSFSDNKASNFLAAPLTGLSELDVVVNGAPQQAGWYKGNVTALITSDQGAPITYSLDGAAYVPYSGPIPVSGEGVHILNAQDETGATITTAIAIDTTGPIVSADVQPPGNIDGVHPGSAQATITAIDPGGSGVQSLTYRATGADPFGPTTVNGRSTTVTVDVIGVTVVTFSAVDAAGNVSANGSVTIEISELCPGDTDCDELTDTWEAQYSCVSPVLPDANADPDSDTLDNLTEQTAGTNPCKADTDGDGCDDDRELGPNESDGGRRNPLDFWDFYDVTGDKEIDISDVLDVLSYFGDAAAANTPGNLRDRDYYGKPNPWQTYETNDGVDIYDAIVSMESFGHGCPRQS